MTDDALWRAISHPKRRDILGLLVDDGPLEVGEIAAYTRLAYPATSQHLAVLARAGLVAVTAEGRVRRYRAELGPLAEVTDWMTRIVRIWRDQPGRLAAYLDGAAVPEPKEQT